MKMSGPLGIFLVSFMAVCLGCSSLSSKKQAADLAENGYAAMAGGDYVTAEYLLTQALAIDAKNPYALLNLGVVYQETQRYDKARQYYQSVIDLNSDETAVATSVQGFAGKNLADIARINLKNLPPPTGPSSQSGGRSDADGDGVPDELDRCMNTPSKAAVNLNGCWALIDIFASGKDEVGTGAYRQLDEVALILLQNPSLRLEVQGHTDDRGAASANQILSEKRAQSVMQYLIRQGVGPGRLQWVGYGQTRPIASNQTAEGRKQNRRVELNPLP